MTEKTKHHWIGWGFDTTQCSHCHIDLYHPFPVKSVYCEDYPAERAAWEEAKRTRPERMAAALTVLRSVLTPEQWELLELNRFGEYRPRDYIR